MSRLEDVSTALWEDEDFDDLSPEAKLLYLWSFTNDRCGMSGVYRVKLKSIGEGCLPPKRRDEAIKELEEGEYLRYVEGFLWVRSRVKHLRTKGMKMARAVIRDIERVPAEHPLRAAFLTYYVEKSWVSSWLREAEKEGLSIPHAQPIDGLQGQGTGQGEGSGSGVKETQGEKKTDAPARGRLTKRQLELRAEWDRWLAHFHEITGRTATTGSDEAKRAFKARRDEGRSVEELMEATVGCHSEDRLREKGLDRPETILRGSKFQRYIELARQAQAANTSAAAAHKAFLHKEVAT